MSARAGNRIVNNFSGGELSELMYGRTDFAKYHTGLKTMKNMLPLPQGGAMRRPGTVFVNDSTLGPDIVDNGLFTADSDWTKGTGWTIAAGKASCDGSQAAVSDLSQTPGGLVAGVTYKITFTIANRSDGTIWPVLGGAEGAARSANATHTDYVTCGSSDALFAMRGNASFTGDIDDVSVEAVNTSVRLIPFEFSNEQAYVLELGAGYIRVMAEQGVVQSPDEYTEVLLHFDEADGAVTAEDASGNDHDAVIEAGGHVVHEDPVFGVGCLELDQSPAFQYGRIPDAAAWDWGTDLFEMEVRWRPDELPTALSTVRGILGRYIDANHYWNLYLSYSAGSIFLNFEAADIGDSGSLGMSGELTGQVEVGEWCHIAVIRGWGGNANDWAVTINGQEFLTVTSAVAMPSGAADIWIGKVVAEGASLNYAKAGFDEFRLTLGAARHTADFQPPTLQYPQAGGGEPYHIPTDFRCDELRDIQVSQSADYLFIEHPDHAPQQLTRSGHTDWTLTDSEFSPPPTYEAPLYPATTLTPGAVSGTGVTFTAGAAGTFLAGDVDRQLVSGLARAIITGYTSGTVVTADIVSAFDSTDAIASGSWSLQNSPTATITPTKAKRHSIATITASVDAFRAGDVGKYIRVHDGIVRIAAYTSATEVSGEVLAPLSAVTATADWTLEEGSWSAALGYPAAITFHEERLVLAGSAAWPQTINGSAVNDWLNHLLGAADADAVAFTLSSGEVNLIQWLVSQSVLFCGTSDGVFAMGSSTVQEPLTPSNVWVRKQSPDGASRVLPIKLGHSLLYLGRLKKTLFEMVYRADTDQYESVDLSILAGHLTREYTIEEMAFQREPYSTLWAVRSDGTLLGFTYNRPHEIAAWHRHTTGASGKFKSVAVIPGLDREEVWFVVQRTVDGEDKLYIEFMASGAWTALEDAWHLDSGLIFTNEAAGDVALTGLDHLEGEEVNVWADGLDQDAVTIASGGATVDNFAQAIVGLAFDSQLETLNLEAMDPTSGSSQGRKKKLTNTMLRLYQTGVGLEVGPDAAHLDALDLTAGELFTGDADIVFPGGWADDLFIIVQQSTSAPLTVLALVGDLEMS